MRDAAQNARSSYSGIGARDTSRYTDSTATRASTIRRPPPADAASADRRADRRSARDGPHVRDRARWPGASASARALRAARRRRRAMPPSATRLRITFIRSWTMIGASPSIGSSSSSRLRVHDQSARDRQHLLLAARQLVAEVGAPLFEPRKEVVDAAQRPLARPGDRRQVLLDRQRRPHVALLRHPADAGLRALIRRQRASGRCRASAACRDGAASIPSA